MLVRRTWSLAVLPVVLILAGSLLVHRGNKEKREVELNTLSIKLIFSLESIV